MFVINRVCIIFVFRYKSMSHLKVVENSSEVILKVDDNGEVVDSVVSYSNRSIVVDTEKNFVFIFKGILDMIKHLSESEIKVLMCIGFDLDLDNMLVRLDQMFILTAAEKTNMKVGTIRNAISSLHLKGVLIKNSKFRGYYFMNPDYIWKGTRAGRSKALKHLLTLEDDSQ